MYFSLKAMLSNAAYFSKTFFTSPILRWILPPAFSAVPRSRKSESPAVSPVFSFTFPFVSSIRPLILSLVLDFKREESVVMRILDVDLALLRLRWRHCWRSYHLLVQHRLLDKQLTAAKGDSRVRERN